MQADQVELRRKFQVEEVRLNELHPLIEHLLFRRGLEERQLFGIGLESGDLRHPAQRKRNLTPTGTDIENPGILDRWMHSEEQVAGRIGYDLCKPRPQRCRTSGGPPLAREFRPRLRV